MQLGCKNKMDFVSGKIPIPEDPTQLSKWLRCNNFVFSWITNSVSEEMDASLIHSIDAIEAWCDLATRYSVANGPKSFVTIRNLCFQTRRLDYC